LPDDVPCRALETTARSRCLALELASVAREFRAAVLHARNTCCWADATLAKLLVPRLRLILGFHGLTTPGPFSLRDRVVAGLATWIGGRFLTPSASGAAKIMSELATAPDLVRTIPNGIDIPIAPIGDESTRSATRARWGISDGDLLFGTVGSLTPVKRHDLLIEAFAQVRRWHGHAHLLLVGDGPLRDRLLDQCRARHVEDAVTITGWHDDVASMLAIMDVYACTSDAEGMNNGLLEALATGLPVVATNVGDNPIIVRPGVDGLISPPGNAAALTDALLELAGSPDRRTAFQEAARSRAGAFRFADTVRAYDAYYRALLPGVTESRTESCSRGTGLPRTASPTTV